MTTLTLAIGVAVILVIFFLWLYFKIPREEKIAQLLSQSTIWSIEISSWFGIKKLKLQRNSNCLSPRKDKENPFPEEENNKKSAPVELLTLRIPQSLNQTVKEIGFSPQLTISTGSKTITFAVIAIPAPADGVLTHNLKEEDNLSTGNSSDITLKLCAHILLGKHFFVTNQKIGTVLTKERKSIKVVAPEAGDIFLWLPSGTSVSQGDTLMLMAIKK